MIKKTIFFTTLLLLTLAFSYNYAFKQPVNKEVVIKNIMNYPMTYIVKRCQKDHNYSDEDMVILERELKRYFALSVAKTKNDLGNGMYSKDVDNLWHTFILFTIEYAEFCNKNFNSFKHHIPELEKPSTPEQYQEVRKDFQAFVKNYEELFKEEIHPIWLLDMCE